MSYARNEASFPFNWTAWIYMWRSLGYAVERRQWEPTWKQEPTEDQLQERDDRVVESLKQVLKYHTEIAADFRRQARESEALCRRLRAAVTAQEWWKLEGWLEREDIESLCDISPTSLAEEL